MKEQSGKQPKPGESPIEEPLQKGGGKAGKTDEGRIGGADNSLEKDGEGDRTDTEEMHQLNDDSGR